VNDHPSQSFPQEPHPTRPQPASIALPSVTPLVTYITLGVTVLIFLLQAGSTFLYHVDIPLQLGAKVNNLIRLGQLWRLITPVLLHGSILHIGFNMYALLVIGAGLERRMGHGRYLLLYLLAGFAGNVFSFLFSSGISVGASTSIFGLLAAEGVFLYHNRALFGQQARRALGNIIFIAMINLFIGLQPGIDNWGHVGGLLGGLIFSWIAGPRWEVEGVYPLLKMVDRREGRDVILGTALVLIAFAALAAMGVGFPITR